MAPLPIATRLKAEANQRRAQFDANNDKVKVPASAHRLVFDGHKLRPVPVSVEEYREMRAKDAIRYAQNIMALRRAAKAP